jgi:hypothetical protein
LGQSTLARWTGLGVLVARVAAAVVVAAVQRRWRDAWPAACWRELADLPAR